LEGVTPLSISTPLENPETEVPPKVLPSSVLVNNPPVTVAAYKVAGVVLVSTAHDKTVVGLWFGAVVGLTANVLPPSVLR
jgi:hypothetical protein